MNLSPSLMCADSGHFAEEIANLEAAGADSFHIDIMDGEFVNNFALSWSEVRQFRQLTDLPFEAHLMVRNLEVHIPFAQASGVKLVYIHVEHSNVAKGLELIANFGMQAGLAINPDTPLERIEPFAKQIDSILMMRVRPGFAGQKALSEYDSRLDDILKKYPHKEITIDGAVTPDVISSMSRKGATGFVLGTSSLFGKKEPYRKILQQLHSL